MHEKRSADELPALIDWERIDSALARPVSAPRRLPEQLRHARHVSQPSPECGVCVAKGRA